MDGNKYSLVPFRKHNSNDSNISQNIDFHFPFSFERISSIYQFIYQKQFKE